MQQAELILQSLGDGVCGLDKRGRVTFVNAVAASLVGWNADQLIGQRMHDVLHHSRADGSPYPDHECPIHGSFQKGISCRVEDEVFWRKDGSNFPVEYTSTPIEENGETRGAVVAFRDITQRRATQQDLQESERRFSTLMGNLPGMAYRCANTEQRTVDFVSDGCLLLTGYPPAALIGDHQLAFQDLVYPDDRQEVWQQIQSALAKRRMFRISYRIINATGDERWVWEQGGGIVDGDGQVVALEGFITDITEQKLTDKVRRLTEEKYGILYEYANDGLLIIRDAHIIECNDRLLKILQRPRNQVVDATPWDISPPRQRNGLESEPLGRSFVARGLAGESMIFEWVHTRGDGSLVDVEVSLSQFDLDGQPALLALWRDITERKAAEQTIRRSEEKFYKAFRSSPDVMGIAAMDSGRIIEANDNFERVFGYSLEEYTGKTTIELGIWANPDDRKEFVALLQNSGQVHNLECRLRTKQGKEITTLLSSEVIEWESELCYLSIVRDITERKRAEQDLRISEERYRVLVEHAPEAIVVLDIDADRFVDANEKAIQLLGYERTKLLTMGPVDISPETQPDGRSSREAAQEYLQTTLSGETPVFEWIHLNSAGEELPIEVRLVKMPGTGRGLVRCSWFDITARKEAEKSIRESRVQLEQAQRIAHLGSWSRDLTTAEVNYSDELHRIFGTKPGSPPPNYDAYLQRVHPDDRGRVDAEIKVSEKSAKTLDCEYRIMRPDGSIRVIHDRARIVTDTADGRSRLVGTVLDITERVDAQQKLRETYAEVERLKQRLEAENIYLQEEIRTEHNFTEIVGNSPALRKTLKKTEQVAPTDSTVLIMGETGTGKELIARAIHHLSGRRERPLVKINCGAIPENLIESELFGHTKGAFTGATQARVGRFELADGGTIFLDEIGELPQEAQVKLLRVLQEHELERVGGSQSIKVDVRVLAATNRDIESAVTNGTFRKDLYYRLNVFPVVVPPLRERAGDIPLLVAFFIKQYAAFFGKSFKGISAATMDRFTSYGWPGNVRELQNVIERAAILGDGPLLKIDRTTFSASRPVIEDVKLRPLNDVERDYILDVLKRTNWVISGQQGAAKILKMHPSTLRSRIEKLGIHRPN